MTRIAIVRSDKCNPVICGFLCAKLCPVNRKGEDCIKKNKKIIINENLCNGCSICSNRCPTEAISIVNLPESLKEDPIIRFSENSFELFSLPIPKKGKIIGILGRNGIGKTTALSILSNHIKPNFGNFKNPPSEAEIIKKYSNSILGDYFRKLYQNEIIISYKPQRVELLSKFYKGSVNNLLKKIDEKNIAFDLLSQLNLESIKNREISKLSGGELQRLAIIATISKNADFYYFDEPASFCDITHRIKVAKIISSLLKNAAVIVVEHDLTTLDYISDELQIVYGKPSCYGIFSQSKAVRRGINEYLDGYLPDDNVRFRDYKINFQKTVMKSHLKKEILFEFPDIEKSFPNFSLKVNQGVIHKGEVLTTMGANGLGKTTFLSILAKKLKPDKGKIPEIKTSYKKQNLELLEGTVLENLTKAKVSSSWHKTNILKKLNLKDILKNEVKNLSGGELQKLHIALNLSEDTELVIMDEPSAFIDVEDRLKVAEIIKDFVQRKEIAAIIVDHDVQFIDFLGDSMLVFEGIPSKKGYAILCDKKQGMNKILKNLDITYRRDKETNRPRINKPESQLDKEQKKKGEYYYN